MILAGNNYDEKLLKSTYVALGNFDGVHKGHLTLIEKAMELAKKNQGLSMVYTFKNHPLHLIDKQRIPKLLMDNDSKIEYLEKLGIDVLCLADFTEEIMKMNPRDFIKKLIKEFNVKGIVVGFNYRFGYKNAGDLKLLEQLSKELDFELHIIEAYSYNHEIVSSTVIRNSLLQGEVEKVFEVLGRPYALRGIVVDGKKLGRTIGFPTANLQVCKDVAIPKIGVYYTNVEIQGKILKGITSVGNNPTVNGKNITVETYILDFQGNIYGETIKVYFIKRIRNEQKFKNLDELTAQLKKDKLFAEKENIKINL